MTPDQPLRVTLPDRYRLAQLISEQAVALMHFFNNLPAESKQTYSYRSPKIPKQFAGRQVHHGRLSTALSVLEGDS